ncbi:histidine kinase [Paraglaciecola aquimarina]|uniref:Histidine kinase n=1 Tax=Paraglaciecola algarum TaxID=3050085 RepID=A0ABS9D9S4_9ALTE|nr:histidine kinase [Paraglaciecola sp. G1-23]MCF2949679.1 histidine kinase [Paraglaciecola sp. G1-23]
MLIENHQEQGTLELGEQAFAKHSLQFWSLQISGWIGYAIVVFMAVIRPQFDRVDFNLSGQMTNLGIEVTSGFILSYFQWTIIKRIVHLPLRQTLFLSFVSAGIIGVLFNVIKLSSYKTVVYNQAWYEQWSMLEFGGWFLFSLSTMFVWTGIFFIMLYNVKLQKEHEMLLRAQTSAKDAQLQMLRYQLNPHFMFNTMNAISTLIYKKDNEVAGEMLDKLCAFFRYSLDEKSAPKSSLRKEIELLDLYLSIEKVRFGRRLNISMDIEPRALLAEVPTLFLQPIVENAIKYGIETRKSDGYILLSAKVKNAQIEIVVSDDGQGDNSGVAKGFGIGLANTKERLDTLFNHECELKISNSTYGTKVRIVFPFQKVVANA